MAYIPNFKWTVGDIDRMSFISTRMDKTPEHISALLAQKGLPCTPDRVKELANHLMRHGVAA